MKEVEGDSINSIRKDAKLVCYTLLGVVMDWWRIIERTVLKIDYLWSDKIRELN